MTDDQLYTSLSANTIMAKLTNSRSTDQLYPGNSITSSTDKCYSLGLTLKMTSAQVVEASVTNNSSFRNYPHTDDHTIRTIGTVKLSTKETKWTSLEVRTHPTFHDTDFKI